MLNRFKLVLGLFMACLTPATTLPITDFQANLYSVVATGLGGVAGYFLSDKSPIGAGLGAIGLGGTTLLATSLCRPSVRFERAQYEISLARANQLLQAAFAPDKGDEYQNVIDRIYVADQYPLVHAFNSLNGSSARVKNAVRVLDKAQRDSRDASLSDRIQSLQGTATKLGDDIAGRMLWVKRLPAFTGQYQAMVAEQQAAEKLRLEAERVEIERSKAYAEHRKASAERDKAAAELTNAGVNAAKFIRGDK
jgi:hypothetical protein